MPLSSKTQAIKIASSPVFIPESFVKGEQFEKFVQLELFPREHFDLVDRTHGYLANEDFVESSLKPDFTFRDRITKAEFYVEAKLRNTIYFNKIEWCKGYQYKRYKQYQKERPVFVVLGKGIDPLDPSSLWLFNLPEVEYPDLFPSRLKQFQIPIRQRINSELLWNRNRFRNKR